jgi:hypothetical protein
MDCNLARRLLPFARPGGADLDASDRAALGHHLETCPACAAAAVADRAFDGSLARAMRAVPVPDGLSIRLSNRLVAARMAIYRQLVIRVLLAACFVVAAGVGWSVWRRPVLDAGQLAQQTYDFSGSSRSADDARRTAAAWLQQFDARLAAPAEFNYRLLSFADRSNFQGLAGVPTLVFARNDATMRVYVVSEKSFRGIGEVREDVGDCTVEVRRYDMMPGWLFVIVTSGAPPEAFQQQPHQLDPA